MNEFLAFNVDAGWATLAGTATAALVAVLFKFYGDGRWQRKPDAETQTAAAKEALAREVKALQATDAEVKKAIEELSAAVKAQDTTRGTQLIELKDQMTKGFENLTSAFNSGILKLSTDAAEMRGRLAGAGGMAPKAE